MKQKDVSFSITYIKIACFAVVTMILRHRNYLVYGRGVTRVSRKSLFLGVYIYIISFL